LEIRAVPGSQTIAAGGDPIVAERIPHGGIVHGTVMRVGEKMVKKEREDYAEVAEDAEKS
jgi:hypothetical protein